MIEDSISCYHTSAHIRMGDAHMIRFYRVSCLLPRPTVAPPARCRAHVIPRQRWEGHLADDHVTFMWLSLAPFWWRVHTPSSGCNRLLWLAFGGDSLCVNFWVFSGASLPGNKACTSGLCMWDWAEVWWHCQKSANCRNLSLTWVGPAVQPLFNHCKYWCWQVKEEWL